MTSGKKGILFACIMDDMAVSSCFNLLDSQKANDDVSFPVSDASTAEDFRFDRCPL